eukprot:3403494-Rhodomonas_salina.3
MENPALTNCLQIERVVTRGFGREKWHDVKRNVPPPLTHRPSFGFSRLCLVLMCATLLPWKTGLDDVEDGNFLPTQQYSSDLTYNIVEVRLCICFALDMRCQLLTRQIVLASMLDSAGNYGRSSVGGCRRRVHRSVLCQTPLHRDIALSRQEYARVAREHR